MGNLQWWIQIRSLDYQTIKYSCGARVTERPEVCSHQQNIDYKTLDISFQKSLPSLNMLSVDSEQPHET
jgi:hypothetical protein